MTLTSYESLSRWFLDSKGVEAAPHWNLYAIDYGQTEKLIGRYVKGDDLEASGKHLERMIRDLNNPDGSKFRVMVYAPGKHNNSNAQAYVQIYERSQAPAPAQTPGIGNLPAGVGSIQQYIDERLETERLKWELAQLKEQVNAPSEKWERVLEYVAGVPGIDKVLQTIAMGLVSKFNPSAMPAIQAAMNGIPGQPQPGEHEPDDESDPNAVFLLNIHEASETLGTDPITMAKRLNNLIKSNPDLARQLLQQ